MYNLVPRSACGVYNAGFTVDMGVHSWEGLGGKGVSLG
jgi:hypothetical protein